MTIVDRALPRVSWGIARRCPNPSITSSACAACATNASSPLQVGAGGSSAG